MKRYKLFFLILVCCFYYSCTYEEAQPNTAVCIAPDVISYSGNIQPIFNAQCATAGCHSSVNPAGNLNLEASVSYNQLMAHGSGYIDTLNPNFSLLYAQMSSTSEPMPPTGNLDKCTLELVLKWIQQKAKNN